MTRAIMVGLKVAGERECVPVEAEDALLAALYVMRERPEAVINYVRRGETRSDQRHPHSPRQAH